MSSQTNTASTRPACVEAMIRHLTEATERLASDVSLGPYLLDELLSNMEACPALAYNASRSQDILKAAVDDARLAVRMATACPSLDAAWIAVRLDEAITCARERCGTVCSGKFSSEDVTVDAAQQHDYARCQTCIYAAAL